MIVRYHVDAQIEAAAAADHIADHYRPGMESRFIDEIQSAERLISEFPAGFPSAGYKCRRCLLRAFPYQLIYRLDADEIVVYAVAHQSRRPGYWRKRVAS